MVPAIPVCYGHATCIDVGGASSVRRSDAPMQALGHAGGAAGAAAAAHIEAFVFPACNTVQVARRGARFGSVHLV
jgi:hypothetical protein